MKKALIILVAAAIAGRVMTVGMQATAQEVVLYSGSHNAPRAPQERGTLDPGGTGYTGGASGNQFVVIDRGDQCNRLW